MATTVLNAQLCSKTRSKMARLNFKGDLDSVRPEQLDFINDALIKKGFKSAEVLIQPMGKAGDNYMSSVKRIDVTENGETLHLIAKFAINMPMMRDSGNTKAFFGNEHTIYTEVFPKFRNLQVNAGVPKEDMFKFAECYGSTVEEPNEGILLQNLAVDNFGMQDRMKPLPNECIKLALEQLAKYHSLSYILKHQEPETFAKIASKLIDQVKMPISQTPEFKFFYQQLEDNAIAMMSEDKYKKALKGTASEMVEHASKLQCDIGTKRTVFQQGDGWTNNILFKYENNNLSDCVLIDYQNAVENSPAFDIIYMIFNSTSHEQRLKHYYEFIDHYHKKMDEFLNYFGLKATQIYPRDQLDDDLRRYSKIAFSFSLLVTSFILRKVDDAAKVQEALTKATMDNMQGMLDNVMTVYDEDTIKLYREKVEGVIESFNEFGLLTTK